MHAQELGFRTILIDDCSRGIQMDAIKNTKKKIEENHGIVVNACEVTLVVFVFARCHHKCA